MEQRQPRLGDTLDDYCPRERRLTTHAVVAIVGNEVKQTRCTGCETEHEYKHAKMPRPRKKPESPAALYGQVAASAPKRVTHETADASDHSADRVSEVQPANDVEPPAMAAPSADTVNESAAPLHGEDEPGEPERAEGPVQRPLIRASLPRPEGQPPTRPIPEFTIRQPGGRPGRFRPRHQRGGGGQQFFGGRSNGNMGGGPSRGGGQRPGGGRPYHQGSEFHPGRRHGPGSRRPK